MQAMETARKELRSTFVSQLAMFPGSKKTAKWRKAGAAHRLHSRPHFRLDDKELKKRLTN
jgi:hypothetical protein